MIPAELIGDPFSEISRSVGLKHFLVMYVSMK